MSGTIVGIVKDTTGAVVPNAKVTIRNEATGAVRSTTTSSSGLYQVPQLAPGSYEVEVSASGFQAAVMKGVVVTIATTTRSDVSLKVGAVSQRVVVSASAAPAVNTVSSSVGQTMSQQTISTIPLNARDLMQLASIQPGVQYNHYHNFGEQLVIAGSRSEDDRYVQEGIDTTWTFKTSPVGVGGVMLGVGAVQEFKVLTSNYNAQYGERMGGVVDTIFKSGTNKLHGSAYLYARNSVFDTRNYFDATPTAPPYRRYQTGASIGGPIQKNKTFYFGNFETFRQTLGLSSVAIVPDANARKGILPAPSGSGTITVPVASGIKPYLGLIPGCNGPEVGGGACEFRSHPNQTVNDDFGLVKIDHTFNSHNSISSTYNIDFSKLFNPDANPNWADQRDYHKQIFTFQDTEVASSHLINTLRLGINRTFYDFYTVNQTKIDSSLFAVPNPDYTPGGGPQFPEISISGLTGLGVTLTGVTITPRWFGYTAGTIEDDVNYIQGKHSLQFGVEFKRWDDNSYVDNPASRGQYTFLSLQQFLSGTAASFSLYVPGKRRLGRGWRQYLIGLYAQDTYRVLPNLTLNYGLRWEYVPGPTEVNGLIANLPNPLTDSTPQVGGPYFNASKDLFAPRIGFNWDPFNKGETSVRGGFGIFFDQIEAWEWFLSAPGVPPFTESVTMKNFPLPANLSLIPTNVKENFPATMPLHPKTPTKYSYNLTIQQQLPWKTAISVGYVGALSRHLGRSENFNDYFPQIVSGLPAHYNYYWPAGLTRPNSAFNIISGRVFDVNSVYNALQAVVQRSVTTGLNAKFSYTLGSCIDDLSNEYGGADLNGGASLQYTRDVKSARGPCSYNSRNDVNFNFLYDIPSPVRQGFGKKLLGDWQISNLTSYQTGNPFDIYVGFPNSRNGEVGAGTDRPNMSSSCTAKSAITGNPKQYFNPNCFTLPQPGYLGNMPSRILVGPNLWSADISLKKNVPLWREGTGLQFRVDVFNLFNHTNFAVPTFTKLFTSSGSRIATAGKITQTISPSRQMQFGLTFKF